MQCPICSQDQIIVEWQGVELDMCVDGHGIWFDAQELGLLLGMSVVEVARFEEGLEKARSAIAEKKRRRCPRCGRKMHAVKAPGNEAPVILDRCPMGHGLWFDDGELEALVSRELGGEALERVRGFITNFAGAKGRRQSGGKEIEP